MTLADAQETSPADLLVPSLSRRATRERLRAVASQTVIVASEPVEDAPERVDEPAVEPAADAESVEDAFIAASRAFRAVTDELPVVPAASAPSTKALPTEATAVHIAPRTRRPRRRLLAAGATVGIMGVAGLLAVSMTLPAEAVAVAQGIPARSTTSLVAASAATASEVSDDEIQAYVASSGLQNDVMERTDDYSTLSLVDRAAEQGINFSDSLYTNDPEAAIQWPFVVGVGMTYGYGMRSGRLHEGIDLVPGAGAPVQSIADGTVRTATESGGNYGVTVYIDHIVDGELITSHYSHMQYGSLRVKSGDKVEVGDIIGKVGNTGRSYGAHMHFELIVNGSTIDPLPWLQQNAGRDSY